jgi:hypothetical protein
MTADKHGSAFICVYLRLVYLRLVYLRLVDLG